VIHSVIAGLVALGAWLAWHLLGDVIGEAAGYALRPITRPVWRAIVVARWPWPLFAMLALGGGAFVGGLVLIASPEWPATVGGILFFGGAGLTLFAPLLWRDAKREAAQARHPDSRPVV
jgi:hypothetical protein